MTLSPIRFSAAYTIDTLEYSFRKRHQFLLKYFLTERPKRRAGKR
jgi:hypothetical protein